MADVPPASPSDERGFVSGRALVYAVVVGSILALSIMAYRLGPPTEGGARAPSGSTSVDAKAKGEPRIVMYSTVWCGVCTKTRAWLNGRGIAFEERDVEKSPSARAEMYARNPRGGVPTLDVDGEVLVGFSPHALEAAIARSRRGERP